MIRSAQSLIDELLLLRDVMVFVACGSGGRWSTANIAENKTIMLHLQTSQPWPGKMKFMTSWTMVNINKQFMNNIKNFDE